MGTSSSNRQDIRYSRRNVSLRIGVVPPCSDFAIGLQGKAVKLARRNSHHIGETGWDSHLTLAIITPARHSSVRSQGQRVRGARGNGDCVRKVGGDVSF